MTFDETKKIFTTLFEGKMEQEEARNLLVGLHEKGEEPQEIAAAASVMRDYSIKLNIPEELRDRLIDVVGTGGDKSGSFNISSTVAIVLASLGCLVAKHGNRAITSNSGSADMLEALGINLNLSLEQQEKMVQESGFVFMFAANHHPSMKFIMPIRKSLPHRTIFNILGPLANPANVQKYLLGVFSQEYVPKIAQALKILGAKKALVVGSKDGLDEISVSDITYVSELDGANLKQYEIDPRNFGLKLSPFEEIRGGNAKENASTTLALLEGRVGGAKLDIVLLNTAAALYAEGFVSDIKDGIEMARDALASKKALKKLDQIIRVSNSFDA